LLVISTDSFLLGLTVQLSLVLLEFNSQKYYDVIIACKSEFLLKKDKYVLVPL